MTMERRVIQHFGHEHPLILNKEEEEDIDSHDVKHEVCSICGVLIFTNSYYSCSRVEQGCRFFVHQQCADQLPEKLLITATGSDIPTFFRLNRPKGDLNNKHNKCLRCAQICKYYTYSDQERRHVHPLCAGPLEIVTKHRSHDHPLAPTRREICGVCDACGEEERGVFLSCQKSCDYWISQDCAMLPPVAMHASHSHPLVLFYIDDVTKPWWLSSQFCKLCGLRIRSKSVYSCKSCAHYAHLKCVKSAVMNVTPEETRKLIAHLPPAREDIDLIINLEQDDEVDATSTSTITSIQDQEFHEHPLIFRCTGIAGDEIHDDQVEIQGWKAICNACIRPISSTPYYSCSVKQCHFLVHEICRKLPSRIKSNMFGSSTMFLFTERWKLFSDFLCQLCTYHCNGFGYSTEDQGYCVDVECALAPRIIHHDSHKNHYLHLTRNRWPFRAGGLKCCSMNYMHLYVYECISCLYYGIHVHCARLPRKVRHKFDKHPLELITKGRNLTSPSRNFNTTYLEDSGFCEFCEELINPRYWFYYCTECDHYLHVDCIPSVGKLSKIKFGGTLDHVGCHDHPVTSFRMLSIGSQTCTYCKRTVRGFEDGLAFHCEPCDIWIHYECAKT